MKIVHAIRTLDPETGGPAAALLGLSAAQAASGHQVVIVFEDKTAADFQSLTGILVRNLAATGEKVSHALAALRPDVVHVHGVWCSLVRRVARESRLASVPYVLSPHGALGTYGLSQKRWRKWLALRLLYARLLRDARLIVATNTQERADLEKLGLGLQIALVPHGLSAAELGPAVPAVAGASDLVATGAPRVLFLGRLAAEKDPELMVRAFARLARQNPKVELMLAGPDGGLAKVVLAQVSALPEAIRRRVTVPGPLYGEEKRQAFHSCSVLCLPSCYESFGMVLLEAMAAGRAVVCSTECGFPEIEAAGAGLVARRDEGDLAAALSVYLNAAVAREAGRRGQALVGASYLWPSLVKRLDELYQADGSSGAEGPHSPASK